MSGTMTLSPEGRQQSFAIALIALLAILALGPLVMMIAAIVAIALFLFESPAPVAIAMAALAALTGMLFFHDITLWLTGPVSFMGSFYAAAMPGGLAALLLHGEAAADFMELFVAQTWRWFLMPSQWAFSSPVGVFCGALVYGFLKFYRSNPLRELKQQKTVLKILGKVGDLPAAKINQKTAATPDGSLIGVDGDSRPVVLTDEAANKHTLVLGTTGSGKTVTVCNIVESAIARGIPLIYIDGKGDYDLACRVARCGQDKGRPVSLFAMKGDSVAYNPLAVGGFTSKKDRIIELREWSEEYYKKLAEGYLQTVFKVMDACHVPCNLATLAAHLDLDNLRDLLRSHKTDIPGVKQLMEELDHQDKASKHIESLVAEIHNFTASEIGPLFKVTENRPTLTLQQVLAENGIAYFCLPALEFPAMSRTLGRLIVNDLKATVAQQLGSNPKTVYVVFDEFSVFAGDQVLNAITMGRSAGIHAVLSTQSLSDIASGRKENAEHLINQVVSNCNNFILHRQNSADDAEKLAALIGTRSTLEYTAQVSQVGPTHMGTVRKTRNFIAHPDEIKTLHTGEAFFFSKQDNSIRRMRARKSWI